MASCSCEVSVYILCILGTDHSGPNLGHAIDLNVERNSLQRSCHPRAQNDDAKDDGDISVGCILKCSENHDEEMVYRI